MTQELAWQTTTAFGSIIRGAIIDGGRRTGTQGIWRAGSYDLAMATYNKCIAQIQTLLSSTVTEGEVVQEDVDLIEELGLASLDVMELIEQLEDIFDISFPINELGDVRTIADLARRVQQLSDR